MFRIWFQIQNAPCEHIGRDDVKHPLILSEIRSPCKRSSGSPCFHSVSPCWRYDTDTCALRLSSPSISHSKPRLISVGWSMMNSPGLTLLSAARAMSPSRKRALGANRRPCHRVLHCLLQSLRHDCRSMSSTPSRRCSGICFSLLRASRSRISTAASPISYLG